MFNLPPDETARIRQADGDELSAIVARLAQKLAGEAGCDPEPLQASMAELITDIKECTCPELSCSHNCNTCTPSHCAYDTGPYYCEDCFAFVPNLPTFCHCSQQIVIT